MSPTLFRYKGYRFFFFSREEARMHVHVSSSEGEAKFWLEPVVMLARGHGLSTQELRELQTVVEERQDELKASWQRYFSP